MKLIRTLLVFAVVATAAPQFVAAACKAVWVDHDFNTSTPAIRKQVCDSPIDIPAIPSPSVRPIQTPQIRPIETPTVPPIGTKSCRNESIYEDGKWVTKRICS
jgi:hypothetical protein